MTAPDPYSGWDSLLPREREKLTARVILVGAESTGKTTLTQDLVQHYRSRGGVWANTLWVSEYGRDYTVAKIAELGIGWEDDAEFRSADWTSEDFAVIALEQQRLENAAASAGSPVLFCDTDALATQIWERRYLGNESTAARDALPDLPPRALYLLTDHRDVEFQQDGIRDGEQFRATMTQWFVDELLIHGERGQFVRGNREERLAECIRLIDEVLAERPPVS
ncbi:nicotinamide riboside kinase [Conyzicola lurida]|uniref:Nicotinamide riboside kinase n=1 Tax=Conyzicola lurida TaxID=1172621 RepID=A0A841AJ83_9MICO|nr:ATP-binding protein [Conyzicola lurida]MBB5841796.1 nicotinamide riboside kinase [Conyzicola lurida]